MKGLMCTTVRPGDVIKIGEISITVVEKTGRNLVRLTIEASKEIPIQIKKAAREKLS